MRIPFPSISLPSPPLRIPPHAYTYDSPAYTLLLPCRVEPYTDGYAWARRPGYNAHAGVRRGEELTDEDEGDGDEREEDGEE